MSELITFATRFTDPTERLIADLIKTVVHLPPHTSKRVCFVVTAAEYLAIGKMLMARDGYWAGKIKGVPLIISQED